MREKALLMLSIAAFLVLTIGSTWALDDPCDQLSREVNSDGTDPRTTYNFGESYQPEYQTFSTACWSVGVWNNARTGLADEDGHGNMWWHTEDVSLMYDGGPVITLCGDTSATWFSMSDGSASGVSFEARDSMRTGHQYRPSWSPANFYWAFGTFSNPSSPDDPIFMGWIEYVFLEDSSMCIMLQCVKIRNASDSSICIHIGESMDWNIDPVNGDASGYDPDREMIYQHGAPSGPNSAYYGGVRFFSGLGGGSFEREVVGAIVLENDTWIEPNSGYVPAEIGGLLVRHSGFETSHSDSIEDLNTFIVVDTNVQLTPDETICYCMVKASSLTGLDDLQQLMDDFQTERSREFRLCNLVPGDANLSGNVDIDDAVYTLAYIFAFGSPPRPHLCTADVNRSCTIDIDDLVYYMCIIFS